MASIIEREWIYATLPIKNPQNGLGTGFLVARMHDSNDRGKIFLVTNKHVIHTNAENRDSVTHITCHFNSRNGESTGTCEVDIPLRDNQGECLFRQHPDLDTDVYAIDITHVITTNKSINAKWVQYDMFATEEIRQELDITVGEDIITIGYPLGLRQGHSNLPLLRQGLISTEIGKPILDQVRNPDNTIRDRTLRAFLIDGATIHGSSGSPVVLKPVTGRVIGNSLNLASAPPVLLGIVAETKYAPILYGNNTYFSFAGLGLVFEVETIKETIELFFN